MVKLRLKRLGKKFNPHYRIVAIKARTKRNGEALEELGHYNPISKELVLKKEEIQKWLDNGAQPSDTVKRLLIRDGILEKPKFKKEFKKSPKRKANERATAKAEKEEAAKEVVEEKVEEKTKETANEEETQEKKSE